MTNQLLPMGSVVSLNESKKKLMIVGILMRNEENETIYDYMGIPFPEGYIDDETMFLFFHKDIQDIHFLGYINAEAQAYRVELTKELIKQGVITAVNQDEG